MLIVLTMDGYKIIAPIIYYIMVVIRIVPLIRFFLSFINYWSLACLYVLLDIKIPDFLRLAMRILYDSINTKLS